MTPADVLDRVLPRWRATLASRYSPGDLDSFIERNRAALESLVGQAMTRRRPSARIQTPHWFELYNPRGGVPRETLSGYRRAREQAAAIFDRALSLLDEPAGEIDLASALAVLGSIDDEGEYDYDEARADADDLPLLVGTVDWSPEEVGDLLAAVMDTESPSSCRRSTRRPGSADAVVRGIDEHNKTRPSVADFPGDERMTFRMLSQSCCSCHATHGAGTLWILWPAEASAAKQPVWLAPTQVDGQALHHPP